VILLGPGDTHPIVGHVKRKLGVYPTDDYFSETLAERIRGSQRVLGVEITGLIEDDLLERLM
jgi:hypothetical protein